MKSVDFTYLIPLSSTYINSLNRIGKDEVMGPSPIISSNESPETGTFQGFTYAGRIKHKIRRQEGVC